MAVCERMAVCTVVHVVTRVAKQLPTLKPKLPQATDYQLAEREAHANYSIIFLLLLYKD